MLNSVGLQNVGVEAFLAEKLPRLTRWETPIIVSLLGESPAEFAELCRRVGSAAGVAALELNLSCPNLRPAAGRGRAPGERHPIVAHDAAATADVIRAARQATPLPLIAKLAPETPELVAIARAAVEAGAEMLTLVNTFVGMALDIRTRSSKLGSLTGGLSGPAIRPIAVRCVWEVARLLRVPVIGVGGIVTTEDVVEFLLAGASAVGIGTAHFANPRAAQEIVAGLRRYCERQRIGALRALIGGLRADPPCIQGI